MFYSAKSLMAENDINFVVGSHIWFGSLEFIIVGEGYDLDLLPSIGEPASFFEPAANLRLCSNELKDMGPTSSATPTYHESDNPAMTRRFINSQQTSIILI
jgi:hypothetical protein